MSSAPSSADTRMLRPTLVLAEALVDRQEPAQLLDRARRLGYPHSLTTALVAACCTRSRTALSPWRMSETGGSKTSPQS